LWTVRCRTGTQPAANFGGAKRLQALVETSPAAIVTFDDRGFIELANHSAAELMAPRDGKLAGNPIAAFLPELHHALRWECRGHRGNGESFTADVWFSTHKKGTKPKTGRNYHGSYRGNVPRQLEFVAL
jgi:PAS domain S-box-containing protein